MYGCSQSLEEIIVPEAELTEGFKPPDVDSRNSTLAFWKIRKCS